MAGVCAWGLKSGVEVWMLHRLKGDIGGQGGRKEPERAVNFPAMAEEEAWKFLLHLCLHQGQLAALPSCPHTLGTLAEPHTSSLHSEMGGVRPYECTPR